MSARNSKVTFPAMDFKFQNTGGSTATLWQYAVEVIEAEVDPTPELKFWFDTDLASFDITAINMGWGPANNCIFGLTDPMLDRLFSDDRRGFMGTVLSGEKKTVVNLFPHELNVEQFSKLHQELFNEANEIFSRSLPGTVRGTLEGSYPPQYLSYHLKGEWRRPDRKVNASLRQNVEEGLRKNFESEWFLDPTRDDDASERAYILHSLMRNIDEMEMKFSGNKPIPILRMSNPHLKWECVSARGIRLSGDEALTNSLDYLYISPIGFLHHREVLCGAAMPPGPTFCSVIDPSLGPHIRTYPISRMIPPGDVERFHIILGATRSCSMRVRFTFSVDKSKVVESEIFDVKIWNPRNSGYERDYRDGEEMRRRRIELKEKSHSSRLTEAEKWELEHIRFDEEEASSLI